MGEVIDSDKLFIIAEISGNHRRRWGQAVDLVKAAAAAGADAVKFQCYDPQTITMPMRTERFLIREGPWKGKYLIDLYEQNYTPRGWIAPLFQIARDLGLVPFASVFHPDDVHYLEKHVQPDLYKVSSFEADDVPLLEQLAKTYKDVLFSTGLGHINLADDILQSFAWEMSCISGYPTPLREAGRACCYYGASGFSDHTIGHEAAIVALSHGMHILEKHLYMTGRDPDAFFGANPDEFTSYVRHCRRAWEVIYGNKSKAPSTEPQRAIMKHIFARVPITKGDPITKGNVTTARGAGEIPARAWYGVIGKKAPCDLLPGDPVPVEILE